MESSPEIKHHYFDVRCSLDNQDMRGSHLFLVNEHAMKLYARKMYIILNGGKL